MSTVTWASPRSCKWGREQSRYAQNVHNWCWNLSNLLWHRNLNIPMKATIKAKKEKCTPVLFIVFVDYNGVIYSEVLLEDHNVNKQRSLFLYCVCMKTSKKIHPICGKTTQRYCITVIHMLTHCWLFVIFSPKPTS